MGWRTTFTGTIHVHYGFVTVRFGDGEPPDPVLAFGGQDNGLCGAADPRGLFLRTGLHTGRVELVVEVHEDMPAFPSDVEEIVEAWLRASSDDAVFAAFDEGPYPLGLPKGEWRVRYSATGMDAASDAAPTLGEPPIDRYLLQLWPGRRRIDRVVRQTSARAEYWHGTARSAPPPSPRRRPVTETRAVSPAERARAARRAEAAGRSGSSSADRPAFWGGRAPSDRLRDLGGAVRALAIHQRDLLDDLEAADAGLQRRVAGWAAELACETAGLATLDWVAPALDALREGAPLPAPFDDLNRAFDRLRGGASEGMLMIAVIEPEAGRVPCIDPRYAALPAVPAAAHPDPLRAAVDALWHARAVFCPDEQVLLDELRTTFPTIG